MHLVAHDVRREGLFGNLTRELGKGRAGGRAGFAGSVMVAGPHHKYATGPVLRFE